MFSSVEYKPTAQPDITTRNNNDDTSDEDNNEELTTAYINILKALIKCKNKV
jgi:hypothetical protein